MKLSLERARPAPECAPTPSSTARVFLQSLVDQGVREAWGIPGGTISPLFDVLSDVTAIDYVATRHEACAAFAALGQARLTRKPALVLTTSGPGLTNVVTAVASAHYEQLPLIVVGGEVPVRASDRGALQDGGATGWRAAEVLRPITRYVGRVASPDAARTTALEAWSAATGSVPGPVFVALPLDVAVQPARAFELELPHVAPPRRADAAGTLELARALGRAKRPLLVLGNGARFATREVVTLAEKVGSPVVVTGHGKGCFPESHPLYLGVIGLGQHPSVDEFLRVQPDVTVALGSRLNDLSTNGWSLPLEGSVATFHVDRALELLGRNLRVTRCLVGDIALTLRKVLGALVCDASPSVAAEPLLRRHRPELEQSDAVPLKPQRVLRALQTAFPDAIWCSDIGEHLAFALHYVSVDRPERFHDFLGFGSMGSGIGAAIGIQRARPRERVVCVCGDGGFSMLLGELLTCVEQSLPVVFVVMNDGRWNMVEHGFQAVYRRSPPGLAKTKGDFALAARALGAVGARIDHPDQLQPALLRELTSQGPCVLDARIDPRESLTAETRSASIRHFTGGDDHG